MTTIPRRLARWLLSPANLTRRLRRELLLHRFRLRVESLPPVRLASGGDVEIHMLFGRRGMHDALAAVKSFYRFAPVMYPLFVHDDGTLTSGDHRFLDQHLPGVRIIPRAVADTLVNAEFERAGLPRCAELRAALIFALKLFDLQLFGVGKTVLYLDSDILFYRSPSELLAALAGGSAQWVDRYNVDINSAYSWPVEDIRRATGVTLAPQVNAGLTCTRRESVDWSLAERCLALGPPADGLHYVEQTLWALDLTSRGAQPLPADYDVCFRNVWAGADYDAWLDSADNRSDVTSQHYCGGVRQRDFFYRDFLRDAHEFASLAAKS